MLPDIIRIAIRLILVVAAIVVFSPIQFLIIILRVPGNDILPLIFHKVILKILAVRVRVSGPLPEPGTLIVSNHVSWLDICTIGSVLPINFVAKADISGWPIFGFLAKLQKTLFIERDRRSDTANQRNAMQDRLLDGSCLVLFPEGTTGDGTIVFPFKSSLFAAAEVLGNDKPIPIQPLSLAFAELSGIPMSRRIRIKYAWIGDVGLLSNMFYVLGSDSFTINLIFHAPTNLVEAGGRKKLAVSAHRQVQNGVANTTVGLTDAEATHASGAPSELKVTAKPLA
ncbi:MAG: 1-acyl-sn-glycerol-3-phosphate acyltransferase [Rhodobiaceae bacterium]|nr:1-acyl-sn-glycerol-3-phosphate acyltransferase [Rhodobiaceae bacterium]